MEPNIVQIDLMQLTKEIEELQHVLRLKREAHDMVMKYIVKANGGQVTNFDQQIDKFLGESPMSVSEFIVKYVADNEFTDSRAITEAYAESKGQSVLNVRNNVSNAITRLKMSGKLDSRPKAEGKGSEIFIKGKDQVVG